MVVFKILLLTVKFKKVGSGAVVVAQLAERSLPTPEIRGSNPDIGNISNIFICQLLSRKDENKEKEAGNGPFKKKTEDPARNSFKL